MTATSPGYAARLRVAKAHGASRVAVLRHAERVLGAHSVLESVGHGQYMDTALSCVVLRACHRGHRLRR